MSRNMHKYEELSPYEFDLEKKRASIIYVSAGPLEYHEEHSVLVMTQTKDTTGVWLPQKKNGGIVHPMLPVAPKKWVYMKKDELLDAYKDETKYPQHYGPLLETEEEPLLRPTKSEINKISPEFAKKFRDATIDGLVKDVTNLYNHIK